MTRFTLHTHTHWATKIFSHNKQKFAPNCSCSSVVEKQRYKDTKAHIIIETLKIGISELQFVNCIQIHANDQLSRVAVGEWVGERERGGISAKGGVFAGNAPWNWSSHLKQFESAHMLCPKLNWTELNWTLAVPQQTRKRPKDTQRYKKIQRYTDAATNGFAARLSSLLFAWWLICLISLPIFLSQSISIQDLRICLIQSCLSSRLLSVWAANHACNMPPR